MPTQGQPATLLLSLASSGRYHAGCFEMGFLGEMCTRFNIL